MASAVTAETRPRGTMAEAFAKVGLGSIDAAEERLMSFLASCGGAENTPSYSAMANQLGVVEEGIRALLGRLENKGRIHFISRSPPRIMVLKPGDKPVEPDVAPPREGAFDRFLDAEGLRMKLGRFIADCERREGKGPSLRAMMDFLGYSNASYVRRMAEILAERGLLQYGSHLPTKLTPQGRQFFGLRDPQPPHEGETAMEQPKPARVVVVRSSKKPPATRVNDLCNALADAMRVDPAGGAFRTWAKLAMDIGYSENSGAGAISDIVAEAIRVGYLKPRERFTHGLFFTEKGKRKFMPETITPPPSPMPAAEEPPASTGAPVRAAPREWEPHLDYAGEPVATGRFRDPPAPASDSPLCYVDTAALIMELVERGYTVRKG